MEGRTTIPCPARGLYNSLQNVNHGRTSSSGLQQDQADPKFVRKRAKAGSLVAYIHRGDTTPGNFGAMILGGLRSAFLPVRDQAVDADAIASRSPTAPRHKVFITGPGCSVLMELVLMDSEEIGIPLVGRAETSDVQLLLTKPSSAADRRIEDWIASNLDTESVVAGPNLWNKLIDNLPGLRRISRGPGSVGAGVASQGGWSRFNVAYRRGITVVRLVDLALVQRVHLQELGCDLMDLIEVGNHRVVLNFTAVERLGSWIIGVVGNAHRRCAAADGGKLKICGLDPQLAEIFSIVGMAREIDLHADEAAAIDSPWPEASSPMFWSSPPACTSSTTRGLSRPCDPGSRLCSKSPSPAGSLSISLSASCERGPRGRRTRRRGHERGTRARRRRGRGGERGPGPSA